MQQIRSVVDVFISFSITANNRILYRIRGGEMC